MPRAQFNPSTQMASYISANKFQQAIGVDCDVCLHFERVTPENIKVTLANILCCEGFNCCPGAEQLFALTDYGNGWNREYILSQGFIDVSNGVPYWKYGGTPHYPCHWSAMINDDFGSFDIYNLGECAGGVAHHGTFDWIVVHVIVYTDYDKTILHANIDVTLYESGTTNWYQIFEQSPIDVMPYPDCFPYNLVIQNDEKCEHEDNQRFGEGTAKITEWPPP